MPAPIDPNNPGVAVTRLYDTATRAAQAAAAREQALLRGQTADYHRIGRDTPEHVYAKPLAAARRQLSSMARERRQLLEAGSEQSTWQAGEVSAAMGGVAQGVLAWLDEVMGRGGQQQQAQGQAQSGAQQPPTGQPPAAPQQPQPQAPQPSPQ